MIERIKKIIFTILIFIVAMAFLSITDLSARTINSKKDSESKSGNNDKEKLQAKTYGSVYDNQKNTVSNIEFFTSNFGIFGMDIARSRGGGYWPRGSLNQYIFGGGFWFGAQKYMKEKNDTTTFVSVSYNPNSGSSWFVPGRINEEGPAATTGDILGVQQDAVSALKYRTYFSIDFKTATGDPIISTQGDNWPIWDASSNKQDTLKNNRYFGYYIPQTNLRNTASFTKGPSFISGEDIFATYKDTDLERYEGGVSFRRERGYPLKLQVEQMIYSWGFGDYRDFIFIKYEITNYSKDTLWNCWLAPVMDVDIALAPGTQAGADNDRVKFYTCNNDTTLNLAVQWSNGDRGEANKGFGYLGFDFLESPAVVKYYDSTFKDIYKDSIYIRTDTILTRRLWDAVKDAGKPWDNFVRKDKQVFRNDEQLGLVTFRNWPIAEDPQVDDERYRFIAAGVRDGDNGPGDKRFMMATGAFHMRPTDTVRVVEGIILANTSDGKDADGECASMAELTRKDKFAQEVYDKNFRAPVPPDRAIINAVGLNNGNIIQWDSTSEMSVDVDERGLDFMGYKIFRARRTDLDTFSIDKTSGNNLYPGGTGPFGWKQLTQFQLPPAFEKSAYLSGPEGNTSNSYPKIDRFEIIGPYIRPDKSIDSMALRVMRIGTGMFVEKSPANVPYLALIDTSTRNAPWGKYYYDIVKADPNIDINPNTGIISRMINGQKDILDYDPAFQNPILDDVMVGVAFLNRSIIKFNPLFFYKRTYNTSKTWVDSIFKLFPDGVIGKINRRWDEKLKDTINERVTTDSIYIKDSFKVGNINGSPTFLIDIWVPRNYLQNMADSVQVVLIQDFLYSSIKNSLVRLDIPDFQQNDYVRKNVIAPYMRNITKNRTFVDIGDDNGDDWILPDANPTKSEKLLNNIEYYYKVTSYDEGDFLQPTNNKINTGSEGLSNFAVSIPNAAPVGDKPAIEVISVDSNLIGGLYNFKFFAIDNDRLIQRFAGHELELVFQPYWFETAYPFRRDTQGKFGLYRSLAILKDRTTGDTLYNGLMMYEEQPCDFTLASLFTENSASTVLTDTAIVDVARNRILDFGTPFAKGVITRTGKFYSGDFTYAGYCYSPSWSDKSKGVFGFSFDYSMQQYAGRFRPDSSVLANPYGTGVTAQTPVNFIDDPAIATSLVNDNLVLTTQFVDFDYKNLLPIYGSFNNGPGLYEVEFLPGATESMELSYMAGASKNTFDADYLNVKVTNLTQMKRPTGLGDSVFIKIPSDVPFMEIQPVTEKTTFAINYTAGYGGLFTTRRLYPDPRNLPYYGVNTNEFIGKFNIHSYGFISNATNIRTETSNFRLKNHIARPTEGLLKNPSDEVFVGIQGKYMKSGISRDKKDTIDFTNLMNISGVQFIFDFANKGKRSASRGDEWTRKSDYKIWTTEDFKAGDKVYLRTYGGALGLPLPGATVIAKIGTSAPENDNYTNAMLDQIMVVPNPYYISHEGVQSPYDSKIYFTKLPKVCTIDIYTITGDLIRSIQHDEANYDGEANRNAVQVWDLLSKNKQRIQSQAFIAVITTPNGSQTVKNFSVVIGGFRIVDEK
jgi:hypothetical protein